MAGALIVILMVVPAMVRATRTFDPSGRASIAPSFTKSFDVPPHAADIPPDLPARPFERVVYRLRPAVTAQAHESSCRDADTLRGPPLSRS